MITFVIIDKEFTLSNKEIAMVSSEKTSNLFRLIQKKQEEIINQKEYGLASGELSKQTTKEVIILIEIWKRSVSRDYIEYMKNHLDMHQDDYPERKNEEICKL